MSYHIYVPIYLICGCALAIYFLTKRDAIKKIAGVAKQEKYSNIEHICFILAFFVLTIALWPIVFLLDMLERKVQ